MTARVMAIEGCDFENGPPGGQLTFAKHLAAVFDERLALVGLAGGDEPIGRWITKRIGGREHEFFAVGRLHRRAEKPLVPARLSVYWRLLRWKREILRARIPNALVLAPEALLAVSDWPWQSVCYCSAGVDNPLQMARYKWAEPLAKAFERRLFSCMSKVDVISARADAASIADMLQRARGRIPTERVVHTPTFVDTTVFHPGANHGGSAVQGVQGSPLIVSSGRLNRVKGWDLVLDAFVRLLDLGHRDARLVYVGDGEDRSALEDRAHRLGVSNQISITGFVRKSSVAAYVASADVVVLGSHREGWPTAIVEALACGKPVVSTQVSGARELIVNGRNGFVLTGRDPTAFADAIQRAINLQDAARFGTQLVANEFSLDAMRRKLAGMWAPLR